MPEQFKKGDIVYLKSIHNTLWANGLDTISPGKFKMTEEAPNLDLRRSKMHSHYRDRVPMEITSFSVGIRRAVELRPVEGDNISSYFYQISDIVFSLPSEDENFLDAL